MTLLLKACRLGNENTCRSGCDEFERYPFPIKLEAKLEMAAHLCALGKGEGCLRQGKLLAEGERPVPSALVKRTRALLEKECGFGETKRPLDADACRLLGTALIDADVLPENARRGDAILKFAGPEGY